jgi:hypothetical protein
MTDDFERFKACAAAYGAHARRWPEAWRVLHARYAHTADGEAVLAAAARTDDFLDAWKPAPLSPAFADRLAETLVNDRPRRQHRLAWSAAAFAVIAAFGFAVGFMQAPQDNDADPLTLLLVGPATTPGIGL